MTLLIEALSGVLDTFLLYLFASGFYSQYRSTKYKGHLYLLAGIFIIVISCIPLSGIIRIILSWNIISISTYAIFESTIHKALLTSTAFITLSVLVDVICEYPFYLSGIPRTIILEQGLARCIFIIFAKLINLLLILFIVTLFGKKGLLDIPFKELLPLTTCQLVSVFICIVSLELVGTVSHFLLILLTLSIAGILYINIVFFVYMRTIRTNYENEQQRRLAEQQLETQLAYYEQLKSSNEQTRILWHDIKKQLTAVTALVQDSDMSQAQICLDTITASFYSLRKIIDVDHQVINAILNDALGKASLVNVDLKIDVFVSPCLSLSPLTLSVILGNTLDNAIRACSGVSSNLDKTVVLILHQKANLLYYHISNPYDPLFSSVQHEGIHGYGLKNVQSAINQNGGLIQINQKDNQYSVEIILNL